MRILIAEDDRVALEILAAAVKAAGHEVTIAQDAMQAVMVAMRTQPDAIVLDIGMPGGSGVQVLQRLKASVKTSMIPIVVVTGSSEPDLPDRVRSMGAAEFMTKPVNPSQLREVLDRVLGKTPTE
jgi:DNA-binding response OmpR family regulator